MELPDTKKRILIFIDWYEPGFKGGGPIRSIANFVANMHHQFEIYLFTSDRDHGDIEPYKNVSLDEWLMKETFFIFYASSKSLSWRHILREIKNVAPDFIYLNSMYSRFFTIYPLLIKRFGATSAEVILAPRGMLQHGALTFKRDRKKLFLKLLNWFGIPQLIRAHATDIQEQEDIKNHLPKVSIIKVIPNFSTSVSETFLPIEKVPGDLNVIFISRISPKKNLLFFLHCLAQLRGEFRVKFNICGNVEDETYWQSCKNVIKNLPSNILVKYNGPIENFQVPQQLAENHIFVLPTLGENFGHAIFEAFSAGRPVLVSDQTPWRNLSEIGVGWDFSLSTPAEFVQMLKYMIEIDNFEFQKLSWNAWTFAKRAEAPASKQNRYAELFKRATPKN